MKDTFSRAELTALRNDLIHDVLIDSREGSRTTSAVPDGTRFRGVARGSPRYRGPCQEVRLLDPRAAKGAGGPRVGHVSDH